LTAHALKGNEQKSLDAGCNYHLVKPIKKKTLIDIIHKHVSSPPHYQYLENDKDKKALVDHEPPVEKKYFVTINSSFKDMIPEFIEDVRNDITSITAALSNADYKTIETLAHRLKGAGGGYGFNEITAMAKDIESSAKNINIADIQKWINELIQYIERVEIAYE